VNYIDAVLQETVLLSTHLTPYIELSPENPDKFDEIRLSSVKYLSIETRYHHADAQTRVWRLEKME
jgi:hypothetical protein